MNYEVVCWPESQDLTQYEGYSQNCMLINSARGIETYGFHAFLVDKDWLNLYKNNKLKYQDNCVTELEICYDDSLIFDE